MARRSRCCRNWTFPLGGLAPSVPRTRDLDPEAVRVEEERGVVAGVVLREHSRRVQHLCTDRDGGRMREIDVGARLDSEREVVEARRVQLERLLLERLPEAQRAGAGRGEAQ